jgi:hypothetical protein
MTTEISLFYRIKVWWKFEAQYYPSNLFKGIKNLIKWFKVIFNDRDWDDHYIWEILKFKLKNQANYIGKHNRHESAKRDVEIMMTCVKLIEKIQDQYYITEYTNYYNTNISFVDSINHPGYKEMVEELIKDDIDSYYKKYFKTYNYVLSTKDKLIFDNVSSLGIALNISHTNHNKAKKLLFKILENNIESWWD